MCKNFNYKKINLYLGDIKGYVSSYLFHLNNPHKSVDIEEINSYLSIIPEIIELLHELIEDIYEKENK